VSSGEKPLILVVDDDASILKLVEALLTRAGLDCALAENATKAAQILKTPPMPKLMILDMMLPDVSGIEFLKQLRAKQVFDDLPVLILSALADPMQIREALAEGADRYLTKPYLANNLVSTVQEILRNGRQKR
jgi:two-component system phosphate regulon response regulator PhoB